MVTAKVHFLRINSICHMQSITLQSSFTNQSTTQILLGVYTTRWKWVIMDRVKL